MHLNQILYIGENKKDVELIGKVLPKVETRLWFAADLQASESILADNTKIDLILIDEDIFFPHSSSSQPKETSLLRITNIPSILITRKASDSAISTAFYHGVNDVLRKPLIEKEITKRINNLIELYELRSDFDLLRSMHINSAIFSNAFLSSTHDGICFLDQDGEIESINLSACNMLNYSQEELVGQSISYLLDVDSQKMIETCFMEEDSEFFDKPLEVTAICKTGHKLQLDMFLVRLSNQKDKIVCVMNDLRISHELFTSYKRKALYDSLTELANRRNFDTTYEKEFLSAMREKQHMALLSVDIDCFKAYNDRYGHVAGDEALFRLALVLRSCCSRPRDFCSRYGGEEFMILLPGTDKQGALQVGEQILQKVIEENIYHEDTVYENTLTVSIGAVSFTPKKGEQPIQYIEKADKALYKAKSQGRNCIIFNET